VLHTLSYGEVSSIAADPIEKKPLFHFYPATTAFSVGGWGCNFHCLHCQNWEIACADVPAGSQYLAPEEQVRLASHHRCDGIAWTYNEPTVGFEYTLDCAKLAHEQGLYTAYVTNGFMTSEALDMIGPWLDAWRVDVKGFSDRLYSELAHVPHWRGILDVAVRARTHWDMHVEVVTNIIPGWNDDDEQLRGIAGWIVRELGDLTPWHVTRFFPMHRLQSAAPTPIETIHRAIAIGREQGLKFVYSGNVRGQGEDTVCYSCGHTAIRRIGYHSEVLGLDGSVCAHCGAELNVRGPASSQRRTHGAGNDAVEHDGGRP
jgi:pyruvate formate lyase activating enzyme